MGMHRSRLIGRSKDQRDLPAGVYTARVVESTRTGGDAAKPGYRVTFEVTDGPHAGCRVHHVLWLTERAEPWSRAWAGMFGVESPDRLGEGQLVDYRARIRVSHEFSPRHRKTFTRADVLEVLDSPRGERPLPEPDAAWHPPAGDYRTRVVEARKIHGLGRGNPVQSWLLVHEVIDGPYRAYRVADRIDVDGPNEPRAQKRLAPFGVKRIRREAPQRLVGMEASIRLAYAQPAGTGQPRPAVAVHRAWRPVVADTHADSPAGG